MKLERHFVFLNYTLFLKLEFVANFLINITMMT